MINQLDNTMPLIGKGLVGQGLVTENQLTELLDAQRTQKKRLGELAVSHGLISEDTLVKFLADSFNLPYSTLAGDEEIDAAAIELIPETLARRYSVVAIKKEDNTITLAMFDPLDIRAIDAIRHETHCRVKKVIASKTAIVKAIDHYYHAPSRLAKSMDNILAVETSLENDLQTSGFAEPNSAVDQLKLEATDVPVVQYVNLLLMRAVQERASDIHIEPEESSLTVRLRIDGQLREMSAPPKHMTQAITTRLKLLSNLDIAERRLPQDGRLKFNVFDKRIDVRVSCLPTIYGEKIVMRILDRESVILDMASLGLEPRMLETFKRTLSLPYGLIILTGPTGSGKTTTLYAALNTIKSPQKNIVTIEDPVEYQLRGINQVHTKSDIGLDFAAGLRAILRQDPDIIMVGEIRDRETAEICIRAALTGHLVLSTLHTNDAVSAVGRLTDMGIEPYLLAGTLNLICAQRLIRCICENCSEPWNPPAELIKRLASIVNGEGTAWNFKRGKGCVRCSETGYRGRIAVYEPFLVTEKMKTLISEGASLNTVREAAKKDKLQTLLKSALNKVKEGVTTLDEAFSVCGTQIEVVD